MALRFSLKQFHASKGIVYQTSREEMPQQNGRVERCHQHIRNVSCALTFQSQLPRPYCLCVNFKTSLCMLFFFALNQI